MVRKNRRCGSMPGASTSKKQKTCFNSYINPKELYGADAYTRIFGKGLLGRSYPIPTTFTQGMRLVNTFEECFEKLGGEEHPQDKLAALHVSQSVVSLASFQGKTRVFACTGTIIKCEASIMSILTSASLVRCSNDETKLAHKLKIKVLLPNAKSVEGKLWKYDLHYNIAVVNIRALPNLRPAFLYGQIGTGKVIAIGRGFESGELMATSGILQYNNSKLDCQELMVSTCKITKAGIGGPLISSGGNFIGLNFYAKEGAPFLPGSILLKCLRHLELFGRVLQPWLGLRIISLQDVKLAIHEEICNSFPQKEGVYVENVIDGSPAAVAGITVGDVITGLDGVVLSDAQQFHELILDKADDTLEQGKAIPFEVYIRRPSDCFEYIATIRAKQTDLIEQNRWPVPKARWITLHGTRVMLDSWS